MARKHMRPVTPTQAKILLGADIHDGVDIDEYVKPPYYDGEIANHASYSMLNAARYGESTISRLEANISTPTVPYTPRALDMRPNIDPRRPKVKVRRSRHLIRRPGYINRTIRPNLGF